MWFGTDNGLFRFDGTNTVYINHIVDNAESLPGNSIVSIAEDHQGFIWVGTSVGAARINASTFKCSPVLNTDGAFLGYKLKFFIEANNNIWAASDAGLYKYNAQKGGLQLVWQAPPNQPAYRYALLEVTSFNSNVLVAGTADGVVFINKHDFTSTRVPVFKQGPETTVQKVYVDDLHELWIGTWGEGLMHFNSNTQSFTGLKWEADAINNVDNVVSAIIKVNTGKQAFIYVGTGGGLLKIPLAEDGITPVTSALTAFVNAPGDEATVMPGAISCFLKDEDDVLWTGSTGDIGVARIAVNAPLFNTLPIPHRGFIFYMDTLLVAGRHYTAVCNWHERTGLRFLNDSLHQVKMYNALPLNAGPDAVDIASVSADKNNNVWVASWRGITILDKNLNILKTIDHNTKGPDTLTREKINFAMVNGDSVWIASYKNGIDLFNIRFKRLKHYALGENNGLLENLIWKFYKDREGRTWLLGNAFLYLYNPVADKFEPFFFSADKLQYQPLGMAERKDGSLLVASQNGLIHFNAVTRKYVYITSPLLDKDVAANAVVTDEQDNIWYITDGHLAHYDFKNKAFTLYGKEDGLDIGDGLYRLQYLGNGKLLIGQENKLVVFTAPVQKKQAAVPYLQLTALYVNDSLITDASLYKGLHLKYNQNRISIEFACINYIKPEQNVFAYRLQNADTGWTFTSKPNITYASLSPGRYVFQIKAANYAHTWSPVTGVAITITPPFWQSWWFTVIVFVVAAAAGYLFFKWRVGNIRKAEVAKAGIVKQISQLEMKALRAQMNPHFVFNSLSSIQESIVTGKTAAASKYLSKFSRLIRLVLENSGRQFISLKAETESLILYLELESFRFENFTYSFAVDPLIDEEEVMVPSMIIQPFIENALRHGFARKTGDKQLKIDIHWEQGLLVAIVEDNGTGRQAAEAVKPLERKDHHSMGVQITEERLRLIGAASKDTRSIFITDLYHPDGTPAGTHVKIILPFEK